MARPNENPIRKQPFPDLIPFAGNPVTLLLVGRETGGQLALIRSVERRGCEPPTHRHRDEDELVYVLEGELTYYVDGTRCRIRAGSSIFLPRGEEHGYRVESGVARLLTVVTPAGLEGYYAELGGGDAEADIERLVTVAARYGVEITGPLPSD
jgi:quercetin dioxygenase-like cupin family protein